LASAPRSPPPTQGLVVGRQRSVLCCIRSAPAQGCDRGVKAAEIDALIARAQRIGLAGDLGGARVDCEGESALARKLRVDVRARARETMDAGRLRSALGFGEEFFTDSKRDPLFVKLDYVGDLAAMRYNQTTIDMMTEYIRQRGSRKPGQIGRTLAAATVQSYVATMRLLRSAEAGYAITAPEVNVVAPAALKRMRQDDAPPGDRVLRRGLRAEHLRQLAAMGYDRSSARGVMKWAVALLAHNLLLRGGEVGVVERKQLDPLRDITLGAVEFHAPCEESDFHHWMTVDVVAVKDTAATHRVCPMPVRRRQRGGTLGGDEMCTYDAVVLAMQRRMGHLPPALGRVRGAEALLPLFTRLKGGAWGTPETRALAREMAAELGLVAEEFGAKSFRIGGATDMRAVKGVEVATRLIKQRGRWWTDIHTIYERALASEHLELSAGVGGAVGRDLECLCEGWVQPATFR